MAKLSHAVGPGQINNSSDVRTVQSLLNQNILLLTPFRPIQETGIFGEETETLLKEFQRRVVKLASPDGIVGINGPTLRALNKHSEPKVTPISKSTLTEADFVAAASELHCEVAAIRAVAQTETKRAAFDSQGRPSILFERHLFSKHTNGKYDASAPDISNKVAGGYGHYSEQYAKLEKASKLDATAAKKSASWGMFQILGENFKEAGYSSVDDFVKAMQTSEKKHLDAFVAFVKSSPEMLKALQQKDWAGFARRYNGKGYKKNDYDTKMKNNYQALLKEVDTSALAESAASPSPTPRVP